MPTGPPTTRPSLIRRLPDAADSTAWEEVVEIYGPLVYRLARKRGLQGADADDLVQEVFTAVSRQVDRWLERPDRGPFRAWLLRIARNISVNLLTRKPVGGVPVGGSEQKDMAAIAGHQSNLSTQFDAEYQREIFWRAAAHVRDSVTETTWLAFRMTHIDQMSVSDAATELAVTPGAVYIARSRVMSRLRTFVSKFEVPQ